MKKVLQIENHVLAVGDRLIHTDAIALDQIAPIELVPQGTVVQIRGTAQHLIRIFLTVQQAAFVDGALA